MKTNIGTVDRVLRIVVGLALLALFADGFIGAWGLIGIVPLGTGLVRFCPLYRVLGVSTCGVSTRLP
jgi:hypothetical protein